jgi:DNA polymerase I
MSRDGPASSSIASPRAHAHITSATYRSLAQTFPVFTAWADRVIHGGQLAGYLHTVFGWTLHTGSVARTTTLRNYPMQANGAEMLRLACCLATERGVDVCAPVHDALLIEADDESINDAVAVTRAAMAEASKVVLGGLEVPTDAEIIRYPDRYADARGQVMWERVTEMLGRQQGQQGQQRQGA